MRKIPTVLVRDPGDRAHVLNEVAPGCEWVLAGEGVATRKYDGTCVMLDTDGRWWARREVRKGKTPPSNYVPEDFDEVTGKTQGWEPVEQSPFAKFHAKAKRDDLRTGTYELVGPKINGNPEKMAFHVLVPHADAEVFPWEPPPSQVRELLEMVGLVRGLGWEGIVWHHPDGRMAKLKVRDLK